MSETTLNIASSQNPVNGALARLKQAGTRPLYLEDELREHTVASRKVLASYGRPSAEEQAEARRRYFESPREPTLPPIASGDPHSWTPRVFDRVWPLTRVEEVKQIVEQERLQREAAISKRREYSERTLELLGGEHVREYNSKAGHEAATVMGMVASGAQFDEVLEAFESHPVAGRFRAKRDFGWLKRAYAGATRKIETGEDSKRTKQARAEISELLPIVATMQWKGRGAINNRKVLEVCMTIVEEVGSITFDASAFRLAEIAMMPWQTVVGAMKRLQALWIITLLRSGKGKEFASSYRLNLDAIRKRAQVSNILFDALESMLSSYAPFSELFSSKVFPSSSKEVYQVIYSGAASAAEVVTRSGRCPRTVRGCLKALRRYGLVRKQGKLYAIDKSCDTKALARFLGVDNARETLKRDHQTKRENRFKKNALKVALETGDMETQRFILCPAVARVH